MTDTKYVPLRKALLWSKGPGADDRLRDAAVALRVAGLDDAIVPLDALRVARKGLIVAVSTGVLTEVGPTALAAIDAALAMTNSEPSMVGSARSAPTQVGFVQFRMRDLERLVAMYLDAAANVPRGEDGRDEEAIDNARAALAAATPPEQL